MSEVPLYTVCMVDEEHPRTPERVEKTYMKRELNFQKMAIKLTTRILQYC